MKKIIFVMIIFASILSLTGCLWDESTTYEETTAFDITLELPSTFVETENDDGKIVFTGYDAVLKIERYTNKDGTATEILDAYLDGVEGLTLSSIGFIAVKKSDYTAKSYVYDYDDSTIVYTCYTSSDLTYVFEFSSNASAYQSNQDVFTHILSTFEI